MNYYVQIILALPLISSLLLGLLGKLWSNKVSHIIAISLIALSLILSIFIGLEIFQNKSSYNESLYLWASGYGYNFSWGYLLDTLSTSIVILVNFVSLMVHIYSIGYMKHDNGNTRFFCYISFFTFAMLLMVLSNNFFQLFLAWEGVGLASYLLIGFWFKKEDATSGSLKAFIVNRVADFSFLLGIAIIFCYVGSLEYSDLFNTLPTLINIEIDLGIIKCNVISLFCLLIFIGAMGKSAQIPLHVWLPESMAGPTPISALIHAATMVTAGIFLVTRLSTCFVLSDSVMGFILIIGSLTAILMGLVSIVVYDIKRVIAYSTLSQLGYMVAALGLSSFSLSVFHLITHGFFKALLFLSAGSVVLSVNHQQDLRKMGGLRKKLPVTHFTFLIGILSLVAIPPFSGFFSKDLIIETSYLVDSKLGMFTFYSLYIASLITAIYSCRLLILTFYGNYRGDLNFNKIKESSISILLPLILLALPSVFVGFLLQPFFSGDNNILLSASVAIQGEILSLSKIDHGPMHIIKHALTGSLLWMILLSIAIVFYVYTKKTHIKDVVKIRLKFIYSVLVNSYWFDRFYNWFFVEGSKKISILFHHFIDNKFIDILLVDGIGGTFKSLSKKVKKVQTGLLSQYLLFMIVSVFLLMLIKIVLG